MSELVTSSVALRGVVHGFDTGIVLNGVDLEVADGEFVVLLGRSGSGKSTLLRLIAGLDTPRAGEVGVDGSTAFAFQEARLLPWRKVRDNVTFGLRGLSSSELRTVADAALSEVGLTDRAGAWPVTLSGGEAQRASLARALVHEPSVLLLDEPFGALDALTRISMQNLVLDLWRQHRFSVVMVTHDVNEAVRLADRILLLDDGRLDHQVRIEQRRPRGGGDRAMEAIRTDLLSRLGVDVS